MNHRGLNTCGGAELTGINYDAKVTAPLKAIASTRTWNKRDKTTKKVPKTWGRAFYVLSFAYSRGITRGDRSVNTAVRINRFKKYVDKYNLGIVTIAPDNPNPVHSGDTILRSCIYTPDHQALWDHIRKFELYSLGARDDYWGEL